MNRLDQSVRLVQELELELASFLQLHQRGVYTRLGWNSLEKSADSIITTLLSITDMLSRMKTRPTPVDGSMI